MPELVIHVPSYIGPSYLEESEDGWYCEWVQGITKEDVEMQIRWAEMLGEPADSILLEISTCDGGSTLEGFAIYNYLRGLGLPIRTRILALAASMAVPLALAADEGPEMDYTAQLMLHSASFNGGVYAETSVELRAQADRLDNTNQLLTDLLIARTGQTAEVVADWMSKDTWLTATQAKAVGLCGKVNPLTPRLTPVEADSVISARRKRATVAMARADKRPPRALQAPKPQAAAIRPAAKVSSPKPMAKNVIPIAKAVGKKPVALTAQQKANAKIVADLAKSLGVDATIEALEEEEEIEAVAEATVLANGAGTLYTDGPLAQGSAVFNDEALTEPTDDATYEAEDGHEIVVAGNVVESVSEAEASTETETEAAAGTDAIAAAITAALGPITARLDEMAGKVNAFSKTVPPTPRPVARGGTAQVDAKNGGSKKPHPMDKAKS